MGRMEFSWGGPQVEADREWVRVVGANHLKQAWILAPTDAWYPNPYYKGPKKPHPESEEAYEG